MGVLGWLVLAPGMAGSALAQEESGAGSPADEVRRALVSSGLGSEDIAERQPEAAIWLDLEGDDTGLALYEPGADSPEKGAMLMLADEGQSAASGLLAALGGAFTSAGWSVMTLGLEAPPFELQQAWKRVDADLPAPEEAPGGKAADSVMIDVMDKGEQDDLESRYRQRVQALLSAAALNLRERGYQRVVLVAVGAGAIHTTRYVAAGTGNELVWLTPRFYPQDETALDALLAAVEPLALLHLYSSREPSQRESARARTAELKEAGVAGYRSQPVAMASRAEVRDAGALANRILAWLKSR